MKYIIQVIKVVLPCILLFMVMPSCNKLDEDIDLSQANTSTRVGLSDADVELDVDGKAQIVAVAFGGQSYGSWSVSSSEEWLTVKKTTTDQFGKTEQAVEISAPANKAYRRSATVTIKVDAGGEDLSQTISVDQVSALPDPSIAVSAKAVNFSAEKSEKLLEVTTNQSKWAASTTADWITVTTTEKQLKISVKDNENAAIRTDTIYLTAGEEDHVASEKIVVTQAKPDNLNEITVNGIELILVKAGSFYMGAQNSDPGGINYYESAAANQGPVHKVTITKDFYIGKYELTQAQYQQIMGSNPSDFKGPNRPVEMVSYPSALQYIENLNQVSGKTFRLPTEAEWEYAARGGQKSKGYIYSGSNSVSAVANYKSTGLSQTAPVGSYQPNELGIYDMSGNVYEWCSDKQEAYTSQAQTDPIGNGAKNILRGGSWFHNELSEANSYRGSNTEDFTRNYLGFRVVYVP